MDPLQRYDSIWSDPAGDSLRRGGMVIAGSLRIETFEGSRPRLGQTRAIIGI
jgi:hypothetical protein